MVWNVFDVLWYHKTDRVPWTARRSNQSVLKETNPEQSLEGLILQLALWYCGDLMWWACSLEKTDLGKIRGQVGRRGWDGQMASPTQWTWIWANSGRRWGTGGSDVLQSTGLQRDGHDLTTTKLIGWNPNAQCDGVRRWGPLGTA